MPVLTEPQPEGVRIRFLSECSLWETYSIVQEVLAHTLTVLRPLSAFNATRALNSALDCFRCVNISLLLISISYGHSMLSESPVQFSGYIIHDPEPQVADASVELLGEDAVPVMDQEAIRVVTWERFAQLL